MVGGGICARDTNDLTDAKGIRINTGVSGNDRSYSGIKPLGQSKESVSSYNRITKGASRTGGRWRDYARDTDDLTDAEEHSGQYRDWRQRSRQQWY